jgi:hypothetical protein
LKKTEWRLLLNCSSMPSPPDAAALLVVLTPLRGCVRPLQLGFGFTWDVSGALVEHLAAALPSLSNVRVENADVLGFPSFAAALATKMPSLRLLYIGDRHGTGEGIHVSAVTPAVSESGAHAAPAFSCPSAT